jgi:hypothetical protein
MTQWQNDKRWSDRFLPEIKGILGQHLIGEPPAEEDAERNTDLMVLRMEAVRIGCRIRKNQYLERYGNEFTIRAGRPSGVKTELTKIIEGWGDYFFYGFACPAERRLVRWALADMKVFRAAYMRKLAASGPGCVPGMGKRNLDNSSSFVAFRWVDFPPEMMIAYGPRGDSEVAA